MSARDELAEIIGEQHDHPAGPNCPSCADAQRAAAAVEVMGYRKPRTITTVEELDVLGIGSVVLADTYRHHANGMPIAFQRWSDGSWHRGARAADTHPYNIIPATVLHQAPGE